MFALRPKAFAVLVYFVTHAGQSVTKEARCDAVRPVMADHAGITCLRPHTVKKCAKDSICRERLRVQRWLLKSRVGPKLVHFCPAVAFRRDHPRIS
jgi:hypothetical protein